jgi:hypothetical protein
MEAMLHELPIEPIENELPMEPIEQNDPMEPIDLALPRDPRERQELESSSAGARPSSGSGSVVSTPVG